MLVTTEAIVLSVCRHSDKSVLLRAYTPDDGKCDFVLYGRRFQPAPLAIVSLSYDHQPTHTYQIIKSIHLEAVSVQTDISRQCVRLFVAEVLTSIFRHSMRDEQMYRFLSATIHDIDSCSDPENTHLRFLVGLSEHLGWGTPDVSVPNTRAERQQTLRALCAHLLEHVDGFTIPKSLDILTEVFN